MVVCEKCMNVSVDQKVVKNQDQPDWHQQPFKVAYLKFFLNSDAGF